MIGQRSIQLDPEAPSATFFTTVADLKTYLDIASGDTSQDAALTAFLAVVTSQIELYCDTVTCHQAGARWS